MTYAMPKSKKQKTKEIGPRLSEQTDVGWILSKHGFRFSVSLLAKKSKRRVPPHGGQKP